jgi:hypothetical protein
MSKYCLRQTISFPAYLWMPLNSQHKLARSGAYHCFDYIIGSPRDWDKFPAQLIYRLMVGAVHSPRICSGKLSQNRPFLKIDFVRRAIEVISLLVFDHAFDLGFKILKQRAASIYIYRLQTKTDTQNRHSPRLRRDQQQSIYFVSERTDRTEPDVWRLAKTKRIDIAVAAGQQNSVESVSETVYVFGIRNQRHVNRHCTAAKDRF